MRRGVRIALPLLRIPLEILPWLVSRFSFDEDQPSLFKSIWHSIRTSIINCPRISGAFAGPAWHLDLCYHFQHTQCTRNELSWLQYHIIDHWISPGGKPAIRSPKRLFNPQRSARYSILPRPKRLLPKNLLTFDLDPTSKGRLQGTLPKEKDNSDKPGIMCSSQHPSPASCRCSSKETREPAQPDEMAESWLGPRKNTDFSPGLPASCLEFPWPKHQIQISRNILRFWGDTSGTAVRAKELYTQIRKGGIHLPGSRRTPTSISKMDSSFPHGCNAGGVPSYHAGTNRTATGQNSSSRGDSNECFQSGYFAPGTTPDGIQPLYSTRIGEQVDQSRSMVSQCHSCGSLTGWVPSLGVC